MSDVDRGSVVRRALVVTDVVGSTARTAELGEQRAAALWATHDAIARELLVEFAGREVDRSDGFLLLFEEVRRAVGFALAYHDALRPLGIAARAGIHVGDVVLRTNPEAHVVRGAKPFEVEGLAKSLAARVSAIAVGGQTLLTEGARAALGTTTDAEVEERGHWRLKGIDDPIALFEVGVRGRSPFNPPPDAAKAFRVVRIGDLWVPVRDVPRNLPAERDAFVGREEDLAALDRALETGRLVSVLGVGGTGKTRLAVRYAWTSLGDWPGGAWFCDLAEARSLEGIFAAVSSALDVPLTGRDPVPQLAHAIAARGRCLLVLDNFEQVAGWGSATVGVWLDRAAEAHVIVTTREVLALPGECVLALAPLPIPHDVETARASPAIKLLVARGQSANRGWSLETAELPAAVALVRILEGIPLAIELASARLRILTLTQMVDRLADRFALLVNNAGRGDRHATLQATLDWSWDLLDEHERDALCELTSFAGGFGLPSAEAVIDVGEPGLDVIGRLVDKSMLRPMHEGRFGMWVTVQEYVERRQPAPVLARVRHGQHFASLASPETFRLSPRTDRTVQHAIEAELDNLVRACERAVARADWSVAFRTGGAATEVLMLRGPLTLAASLLRDVLALEGADARERGRCEMWAGIIRGRIGDADADANYDRALALARDSADGALEGEACRVQGLHHAKRGRGREARAQLDRALAIAVARKDPALQAHTLHNLGVLQRTQGELDESRASEETALVLARELGAAHLEGTILGQIGIVHAEQGRHAEAREMFHAALRLFRQTRDRGGEGAALANLGIRSFEEARLDEARGFVEEAIAVLRNVGERGAEALGLGELGGILLEEGQLEEAREQLERSLAIAREVGNRVAEGRALGDLGELARRRGEIEAAVRLVAEGERTLRPITSGPDLAKLLCTKVQVLRDRGELQLARSALDEATTLADSARLGPVSEVRRRIARAEAALGAR